MDGQALSAAPPLALIEVLDRDGQVRHSLPVHAWPVSIGRAIDNGLVLADPHVAAHHLRLVADGDGVAVEVGETRNGAELGRRRLAAGSRAALPADGAAPLLSLGRTRLRLRLPSHALEAELPLALPARGWGTRGAFAGAAFALVAALLFRTWLDADPDLFGRAAAGMALAFVGSAAVWCGAWALLSRIFTRQAQFGWHLRVFVLGSLAYLLVEALAGLVAFALGWAWVADFAYVATLAVAGATLTWHLLAVEPARPRLMRAVGTVAAIGGIVLTAWFNVQRSDRLGNDLYLTHLMPPALRLAPAKPVDDFVDGLAALQPVLDRKARETENGEAAGEE